MSASLRPPSAQLEQMAYAAAGRPGLDSMFYRLAEAYWQARDFNAYAWCFRRAYQLNPAARFADVPLEKISRENAADIRERSRVLIAKGVAYSAILAALASAEALLGNGEAVRQLMDCDRLLHRGAIEPPAGMPLDAFNAALADEIRSDLNFFGEPEDRAIRHAWRFEGIRDASTPAVRLLKDILRRHMSGYIERLPTTPDHPLAQARQSEFDISGWAVVSGQDSHHLPHVHSNAWITGVYYVVQPAVSRQPGSRRGWLRIGPPQHLTGAGAAVWENRLVEPVAGTFVLMPGYFWHDTEPMGVDEERICIAFEAGPPELAGAPRSGDAHRQTV